MLGLVASVFTLLPTRTQQPPTDTVGPTMLGLVASVFTLLPTRTQQQPTLLGQQCWELLRPFACSFRVTRKWTTIAVSLGCLG